MGLFAEALMLGKEERAAYLARQCAGDTDLLERVATLLKAHEDAGAFLEEPPADLAREVVRAPGVGERAGDQIGRYRLLRQIGEGGCGVVFMAEQETPVRRSVALKIIKPGMDTKGVIARFEAERQALALMDHPNIAKVFDAGATESGRPYFVMELIRGVKITEYCDGFSLGNEDRLKLFVQVCQAVQHAHQKGIIHRDIKPSNILVTRTPEGDPLPVVIDFGIAKATTNRWLTDKTLFTASEMLVGTPAYMSPEQAAPNGEDLDTRTDIYSLGVLLYELLTGTAPFDTAELARVGVEAARRLVAEKEPVRPSAKLAALDRGKLQEAAVSRGTEGPRLLRSVKGDLDWIVMKALEKDRRRRYETANGLAVDIQRFLANEAISARPPSRLYQFRKILVRNKLLFGAIGTVTTLLVGGLIMVMASLARERRALSESERDRLKAQQVTAFLKDMLQGAGPSVALGRDTAVLRDILDRTALRVGTELTNQPAVEAELRNVTGRLYMEVGDYEQAERMLRASLAINRALAGPDSRETADSLNDLGLALIRAGKWGEAEGFHREALRIRRALFGEGSPMVAVSLGNIADVLTQRGAYSEAEPLAREALAIRRKRFGEESVEAASALRSLCVIVGSQSRWSEAESAARQALVIRRKRLDPKDPIIATTLTDLAWAVGGAGRLAEAETLEKEALAMRQKVLSAEHPDVSKSLYLVGDRMRQRGLAGEAEAILGAVLMMQRKQLEDGNPTPLDTMHSLGAALEAQGRFAEAERLYREELGQWRKRGDLLIPQGLAAVESVARVLLFQKRFGEAVRTLDEVLTPELSREPKSMDLLWLRSQIHARRENWKAAAEDGASTFELYPSNSGRYAAVAAMAAKAGDHVLYERICRKMLEVSGNTTNVFVADQVAKACLFRPAPGLDLKWIAELADLAVAHGKEDAWAMPFFQICKGLSEYRQGRYSEAEQWLRKTLASPSENAHPHAGAVLAMALWKHGDGEGARQAFARAGELTPREMPQALAERPGEDWLAWLFARVSLDEAAALMNGTGDGSVDGAAKR